PPEPPRVGGQSPPPPRVVRPPRSSLSRGGKNRGRSGGCTNPPPGRPPAACGAGAGAWPLLPRGPRRRRGAGGGGRAGGAGGAEGRRGGVAGMLRRVSAVQLDTISVLARSHELVAYARLGPVRRDKVERAYWHPARPAAFEYWAHAACVLPLADWPYYAARRRGIQAQGQRWHQVSQAACEEVLARLKTEGPLTATQLGGAKAGGPWWDWSEVKIAAEWLLDTGQA